MRILRLSKLKEAGDTIIEVLISLSIISLVLVGAYASVRHNTTETQTTQERTSALQLAQGQVEFLRAAKGLPSGKTCFDQSGAATSGTGCTVTLAGGAAYTLTISLSSPGNVYTVKVVWTTLSAHANNDASVTLYYKSVQ